MPRDISENEAKGALEKGFEKARETLKNAKKIEELLQKAEEKLKVIPKVGDTLAYFPILVSLLRSYFIKEYTEIPASSMVAIVSAIIYVVTPIDIIPDFIPVAGYLDDAAVIAVCYKLVKTDLDAYCQWREENGKKL